MAGEIRIGTSGWNYDHWKDVLYPRTPASRWLEAYAEIFDTVELNASFYHWPRSASFASWRARLPPGFRMAVKAPRGLTHARTLRSPEVWAARIAEGVAALGPAAGPLLLQLPPDLERDDERLEIALTALHPGVPVVVEMRHPSWQADEVFALLERHGATACVMSGAHLPCVLRATAPLVYVRMHGPDPEHLYVGGYPDDALSWWADRIAEWRTAGHDVAVYFNNDDRGYAVQDALLLRELVSASAGTV